ncbi:MAG: rhomboid family intramembrane serine protease [Ilumatobacter sp.]|uniref:rhomboid family intramembrane serine protease n=1 Tax=Ilumatobacter sp. TaxID=1967498 RepID=UPI0026273E6D|nr:rhomboid family intramembrane serine protease [Ilumatobacter sp.]MDJ0771052.1 rhomboid family intramembrane serine protease [Ilumatobacter sp.]
MAGRFSYSSPESRYGGNPWFRVGELDVTTAVLVAAGAVLSMFVWAASPDLLEPLVLDASEVRRGQIWRLITWPFANAPDIWTVITIAIFWYFGRELEGMLGRDRFAWFLSILTVIPAVVATVLDLDVAGIRHLELGVFLVFIAEFPFARFFFGIPGWVIGAVIVGIQVLQLLGIRDTDGLAFLAVLIATSGLAARSFGLATHLPWIPKLPFPGSGDGSSRSSRSSRTSRPAKSRARRRGGSKVVEGPWTPPTPPTPGPDAMAAQAELDALLDKISDGGLDSLSHDEKRRLNELSKRLR